MRKLLCILLFLPLMVNSQHIKSDEIDAFTGSRKLKITLEKPKALFAETLFSNYGFIGTVEINCIQTKDTPDFFYLTIGYSIAETRCFNDDQIIFLLEDGNKVTLKQFSKIDCGKYPVVKYQLFESDITLFLNSKIQKVRVYTSDGYIDLDAKEKAKQKFIDSLLLLRLNLNKK